MLLTIMEDKFHGYSDESSTIESDEDWTSEYEGTNYYYLQEVVWPGDDENRLVTLNVFKRFY